MSSYPDILKTRVAQHVQAFYHRVVQTAGNQVLGLLLTIFNSGFYFILYVLHLSLFHLPPLRFHCRRKNAGIEPRGEIFSHSVYVYLT
jgi:hypothetical protein